MAKRKTQTSKARRSTAKRSTSKRTAAKAVKPAGPKRATARRSTAKRSTTKQATGKRATAKRATAKRSVARRKRTRRTTDLSAVRMVPDGGHFIRRVENVPANQLDAMIETERGNNPRLISEQRILEDDGEYTVVFTYRSSE